MKTILLLELVLLPAVLVMILLVGCPVINLLPMSLPKLGKSSNINGLLVILSKVSLLAKNKNADFIVHVDEKTIESLGNIKAVFDSDYNNIRNTFIDYEIDINGEKLEKKVA